MPISRVHRPRQFKDVTGQRHITEVLQKEVASGVLGHAFLFSGPRGVGKTTTARIFAKALLNEETVNGEPPTNSDASREVDAGSCIDLIELDAASHTGVENVREAIIEHVRFAPSRWKRKVYIIDECHMLSTSAWNALLKTLEEPPIYAFFILATTELHKVPATIASRCQRFEFHRISPEALNDRIASLAAEEGVTIEDSVIRAIVGASDGCVRDAESILDQIISLGEKKITRDLATLVLPTSRIPEAARLFQSCLTRDVGSSLHLLHQMSEAGIQPLEIINDFLSIARALIRCEDSEERKRFEDGDDGDRSIAELVGSIDRGELGSLALSLIERRRDVKSGIDPQFAAELIILSFAGGLLGLPAPCKVLDQPPPATKAPTRVDPPISIELKKEQQNTNTYIDSGASNDATERVEEAEPTADTRPPQAAPAIDTAIDLNDLLILWNTVIREVEKENRSIPFILKVAKPIATNGNRITLGFAYDFHKEKMIDDLKMKAIVERAIAAVLRVDRVIIDGSLERADKEISHPQTRDIVAKVLETFGGEIVA